MRAGLALNAARQSGLARYYDSRTGTFCSADPLAGDPSDPQSWNRYPYGRNDPIGITDPSGKSWWSSLLIDVGVGVAMYFLGPEIAAWLGSGETAGSGAAAAQAQTAADVASGAAIPSSTPGLFYRGMVSATMSAGGDAAGAGGGAAWGLGGAAAAQAAQTSDPSRQQQRGGGPAFTIDHSVPKNARDCTAGGKHFYAPPSFNVNAIENAGKSGGAFNLGAMNATVGHYGTFDFQRVRDALGNTTFYSAYTPVSNVAVGVYLYSAGYTKLGASVVSDAFAAAKSKNAGDPNQALYRNVGVDIAAGKATVKCSPAQR
jgi:hypothetical protein